MELKEPDFVLIVSKELQLRREQVRAAVQLLQEGNTIPFIARYRKEMTGSLDENQLRSIQSLHEAQTSLYKRKCDVLRLLEEQGALSEEKVKHELTAAISAAVSLTEVEDIYRPYRPKRRTRASIAGEKGLLPLASWLLSSASKGADENGIKAYAQSFVSLEKGVQSADEAIAGALDIFAEMTSDDAETRGWVRSVTLAQGQLKSLATSTDAQSVYEAYYKFRAPLANLPAHRILAINRGEREEFLKVSIEVPQEDLVSALSRHHVLGLPLPPRLRQRGQAPSDGGAKPVNIEEVLREAVGDEPRAFLLATAVADGYKRLLAPSIEREVRTLLTERAEERAIEVFGENLHHLLMQAPLSGRSVLGVDPAYRTGCKLAVVDDTGKLLETSVIYPTPPRSEEEKSQREVLRLLKDYQIGLIALGNGTASRETEAFIARCTKAYEQETGVRVPYTIVSEAGASVYSASPLAGEEFPQLDVSERSAISIARRILDPLAELVKIDPKSIGVGQYQHDVSEKKLDGSLSGVVETVVNQVGVNVNTASPSLLSYVSGLNKTVAKNIASYREQNGRFINRRELAHVPRLGAKTLEQCVGFLRILDGDEVLDMTPIHPESYQVVQTLLEVTGQDSSTLSDAEARSHWLKDLRHTTLRDLASKVGAGEPTLKDILEALERPARDPREEVAGPVLRTDVLKLEDLAPGMVLTGTVRNVVDFGAFVDVGIKDDGLVHISQLSNRFVKHPTDVVAVGDIVTVRVLEIDVNKQRLSLSMKDID